MDRPFYSITINGKNTWDEWKMMPVKAGKIEFATPEMKYESVEIAGSDNALDMSEVLTGYPLYESRRGSLNFRFFDNGVPVRSRFDQLKNFLHGKKVIVINEDQPEYYYEGRMMVGDFKPKQGNWGDVEISYILNAYKLELTSSSEDWLWDTFNFETGVIREYKDIEVISHKVVTVIGSRKPTVPRITVSSAMTLVYDNTVYELSTGRNVIPQIVLMDEGYEFNFYGIGTVTIDMTAGSL